MSHFVSNGDGLVVTVDSESGDVLWIQNYASPVVAFYIWQREGLRKVMHTNVGIETLRYLTFMSGEVGHITKWKYPFPKETETKSKLTWAWIFLFFSLSICVSFVIKTLLVYMQLRIILQVSKWWKEYIKAALVVLQLLFYIIFWSFTVQIQRPKNSTYHKMICS